MYWWLCLLPGTSKKWKVCPIGVSAGNAHFPALNRARARRDFGVFVLSDTGKNKN